jgi:hypothetical protein
MKKRTAKARPKVKSPRFSRSFLIKMIKDLEERLRDLRYEAEAMATVIAPNSRHIVIEHQTRMACTVMLASLQRRISDVEGLAAILAGRSTLGAKD